MCVLSASDRTAVILESRMEEGWRLNRSWGPENVWSETHQHLYKFIYLSLRNFISLPNLDMGPKPIGNIACVFLLIKGVWVRCVSKSFN